MSRILIMEDDDGFREMLREMLEIAGHDVLEATDGEVGTKMYRKEPTDLIIIDIFMPWKDGLETIRELRRDYLNVKIIAISGGGKRGDVSFLDHARDFGAQNSFTKPFERQEMLDAIEELLGHDK